jgi:hypothetical protein
MANIKGLLTHTDTKGTSVIDLLCVSYKIIPNILDFKVLGQFYSIQVSISIEPICES